MLEKAHKMSIVKVLKIFSKKLKKVEKTVDKGKEFVVLYTSCRREGVANEPESSL